MALRRPHLIVGHVGSDTARIWVHGSAEYPTAFLTYRAGAGPDFPEQTLTLEERHGFTTVFSLQGLTPSTRYRCEVSFGRTANDTPNLRTYPSHNIGVFETAPLADTKSEVCFLLASCNLHSLGIFSSPDPAFERVGELIREQGVNFMIHCGDQIYADIPLPITTPNIELYRGKYMDAWGDSEPTTAALTMIPHYMILDDHEMINDFSNDMEFSFGPIETVKIFSLKAYREFQHLHNPQTYGSEPLYYSFSYGHNRFFVMDVRTERFHKTPHNQIIGEEQLGVFLEWLRTYRNDPKFVVSSVPFVAEVRDQTDKWCSPPFLPQRERIIEFIAEHKIPNIIFLTGDMHNSHYATMEVTAADQSKIMVHELMSSPLNQILKAGLFNYNLTSRTVKSKNKKVPYRVKLDPKQFFSTHSNVMCIRASGGKVTFEIFRTKKAKGSELSGTFPLV
jgi:phosphodiesterase/alkaline phosphatase D-like protein